MGAEIKVELQETMGSDKSIANAAWTSSFDKEKRDNRSDSDVARIVRMLGDLGHSTPFESVVFRFWLRIPIFIDRQIMTHRLQSASGLSGRYRTLPEDCFGIPEDVLKIIQKSEYTEIEDDYNDSINASISSYNKAIKSLKEAEKNNRISNQEFKRAREILRGQVPVANMTERTTVMNLRAFANFYKLRSKSNAQPEIQEVANKMLQAIKDSNICPEAIKTLERNDWKI